MQFYQGRENFKLKSVRNYADLTGKTKPSTKGKKTVTTSATKTQSFYTWKLHYSNRWCLGRRKTKKRRRLESHKRRIIKTSACKKSGCRSSKNQSLILPWSNHAWGTVTRLSAHSGQGRASDAQDPSHSRWSLPKRQFPTRNTKITRK